MIFIAEGIVMFLFFQFRISQSPEIVGVFDAIFLTVLVSPALYVFMFRPLIQQLQRSQQLEKKLFYEQGQLESKINERTKQLQKLNQAVEQSPASVVITNTDGTIEYVNPKFVEVTGYSFQEAIGQNPRILKSGVQNTEFYKDVWDTITLGEVWRGVFSNRKKNGDIYWESASIAPIKDSNNKVTHYVGVKEDITIQKEALEALKESEENYRSLSAELKLANNMKELLLDIISHDLKNPAGVIIGMAEIGLEENPDDKVIQLIKSSSDSLLQVIDKATILSKVAFDEEIEKENLNLNSLMNQVIEEFTSILERKDMSLEYQPSEVITIEANSIVSEIFKNYISNAIKYAQDGKRIIVEHEQKDDYVTIMVKDFGMTIPEEEYANIFERSVQLSKNEKRGQGLGLAIVKRIAEAHNAEVGVKPNTPKGNIFYLKIPCN